MQAGREKASMALKEIKSNEKPFFGEIIIDFHHIDWAVILVSWVNFGPKEHALGELPGGDHPKIARVRGSTPARVRASESPRQ